MTSWLDDLFRLRGLATIAITDSASPTVASEAAAASLVIVASGTVTAARALRLPHKAGAIWVVENATGYDLSVSGPTGAAATVAAGERTLVYSTGSAFKALSGSSSSTITAQEAAVAGPGVATLTVAQSQADYLSLTGAPGEDVGVAWHASATRTVGTRVVVRNATDSVQTLCDPAGSDFMSLGALASAELVWITSSVLGIVSRSDTFTPAGLVSQVMLGNGAASSTVPAGSLPASVVQAGSAPAIDASHRHVYACGETSGTTLADTGSGTQVAATLLGSAGVAYALGSPRPFARGTKGLRLLADTLAHGAQVTVAGMGIGAYTIECFGLIDEYVASSPTVDMLVTVDDGSGNNAIHFGIISTGLVFGGTVLSGVDRNTTTSYSQAAQPVQLGVPAHWMAVYDPVATPTFKLYRNGSLVADNNQQSGAMASLSRITIGNSGALDAGARGAIAQVRVSPVARSAAYALAAAEALFAL